MAGFFEGVTQLPRELAGGAAIALGADREKTNQFLGLEPSLLEQVKGEASHPEGIIDAIEKDPGKFIGELVPYVFLPMRLFGKATGKALKARAKKTKTFRHRAIANAEEVAHMGAAFGTYGAAQELARAKIEGRESEAANQFVQDGLFAVGFGAALKGAFLGAQKIKSEMGKSKYVKDFLIDAGVPPKAASGISKMSDADKTVALSGLDLKLDNMKQSLAATMKNTLPGVQLKPVGKEGSALHGMTKALFGELPSNIEKNVAKVGERPHNKRPDVLPKKGKGNIAKKARKPVGALRSAADDMNAHLNSIARHASNARIEIVKLLPDPEARARVTAALDVGGKKVVLSPEERIVADKIRETFDQMGRALEKRGVIKGFRKEYIPHILNKTASGEEGTFQEILDSVAKRSHTSTTTERGLKRELEDVPLHERSNAKTLDIAEIVELYTHQVGHATAMRNVVSSLDESLISIKPKKGWVPVSYGPVSKEMQLRGIGPKTKNGNTAFTDTWHVHPDYKPSLDLLFQNVDMGNAMKAVIFSNFASKRALILGSLFHFNALSESALFAGAGGIGAVAKGAGAGFLVTGGNPLGAAVGAGIGVGARVLVNTKNITAQLRGGKYGDLYDYALRYIDLKPPRDVGTSEFYEGLSSVQGIVDKYVPTKTARGFLKKGTKAVNGINKAIDVLMWHRLMAGGKLIVFQRNLERLVEKNMALPKKKRYSQHELATMAGQFTNDAFGGQNWRKLAEGVDNSFGRRIAAAVNSPRGQTWANLIMFAPDWTLSNLRILAKSFPGINKDPISREIYQRYATRAAIYYMIMGSAIQMALTGKPIFANEDPTKLDLGDGRTMTFSKQLMEPFHWIADPVHSATVKQSSAMKIVEEFALNKQYVGGGPGTPAIWDEDQSPVEKTASGLKVAGKHFAPIFVQDIGRNGMEGVYGFFGHPIYGHIRHGFKNSNGNIEKE